MSISDFQDQFVANKGQPITFEGLQVHLSIRVPVATGDQLRIRLLRATPAPIQGLRLRAENAVMAAVNDVSKMFVIWDDTAPAETLVTVQRAKPSAQIILRNVWKDGSDGAMMQGLRFAGMVIETDDGGSMLLRCSDGRGEPDFDDLIAKVSHSHAISLGKA